MVSGHRGRGSSECWTHVMIEQLWVQVSMGLGVVGEFCSAGSTFCADINESYYVISVFVSHPCYHSSR